MKYQVLARKYRPKTFSTMIGQEHVLKALTNALESERLHHAYLFTGTRGVGKTTVARVLAKALNCEQGISASPCGECPACQEIEQGCFVDLIEVDAASRTKVEDTRELLDNVQYAPTRGRFKIYLIDEVHMLSGHSFNALLKTLEEPPPHVKFLLATTDPQKLPVTILSRCLQFNLKHLNIDQIEQQLSQILSAENIPFEPNVLKPLAIAADGSMRDALSLLDQAIAYSNGHPNLKDVEAMLGSVQKDRIFELLTALANEDGNMLIQQSRVLTSQGIDVNTILAEMLTTLQRIALSQMVPGAIDNSLGDQQAVEYLAQAISPEDIQLYYQIGLNGRKDLPYSPQPQGGFEMILLRMLAFKPVNSEKTATVQAPPRVQLEPQATTLSDNQISSSSANVATEKKTLDETHSPVTPVISSDAGASVQDSLSMANTEPEPEPEPALSSSSILSELDSFSVETDLPPLDAYGQEYFQEADEQSIPLFDDLPVDFQQDTPVSVQEQTDEPDIYISPQDENSGTLEAGVSDSDTSPRIPTGGSVSTNEIPCEQSRELVDFWHDLIQRSEVKGLEQQLAKHCALVSKSEQNGQQYFELLLETVHKHLLSDKIQGRLIDVLQPIVGAPLHLDIKECQAKANGQLHTPRRREIHEAEVLQQQAIESINADPKVKMLVEAFGARIREETIKPIT